LLRRQLRNKRQGGEDTQSQSLGDKIFGHMNRVYIIRAQNYADENNTREQNRLTVHKFKVTTSVTILVI
jgi:hypothetical protein